MTTLAIDFTNDLGQVIKPGDECVIVTTGYGHDVSTDKAIYLGRYGSEKGGVQCTKKIKVPYWVFKDTGEEVPSSFFTQKYKEQQEFVVQWRAGNPNDRSYQWTATKQPGYKAIEDKYMNQIELKHKIVDKKTTLQLNRIYKLAA